MSTIHDLRTSLDEHASSVQDHALASRAAEVHQRVRHVRRRRQAVAVAAAAVVVAGVVGVTAALPRGDRRPFPAEQPTPTDATTPSAAAPVPQFPADLNNGAVLLRDLHGRAGQADLRFRVAATGVPPDWSFYCAPAHSGWFTVTFNGVERVMGQCNRGSGEPGVWTSSFDDLTRADGSALRPGDPIHVRMRLFENRHTHRLVSDPDLRLAVGVYLDPTG